MQELTRKFFILRWAFQALLVVNVFLIAWGVIALVRYFDAHDASMLELAFVGTFTLFVGFIFPFLILTLILRELNRIRREMQERAMSAVAAWLEGMRSADGEMVKNPLFWTNLGLAVLEALLRDMQHPAVIIFKELSPVLRAEISKRLHGKSESASF